MLRALRRLLFSYSQNERLSCCGFKEGSRCVFPVVFRGGWSFWRVFCIPLVAQEKNSTPVIPREVLFGNPERASPEISPDGKQLAYLAPVNGVLNVWVRTLGKEDDRAVTADKYRGIRNYLWQYDNQHILYTQDAGGDENWRLYQTDISSKQTKDLTAFEKVRVDIVAYDSDYPDTMLLAMNRRDPKVFDVHRLDLKSGKIEMDTENPGDVANWQADNALRIRAAQVQTPDGGTIIRVRDSNQAPWRELIKWGPDRDFWQRDRLHAGQQGALGDHQPGRECRPPAGDRRHQWEHARL